MKNKQKQLKIKEKKQTDTLNTLKPKQFEPIKDNKKLLKYKKVFDELSSERIGEIYKMSNQIHFNDWTYYFKVKSINPINVTNFKGRIYIYDNIKNGNISIQKTEEDQKHFKSDLNEITKGNLKYKSKVQLNTIENIKNFYESRKKVIKLYNDYAKYYNGICCI